MTSPTPGTIPRPHSSTDPPRRTFGSISKSPLDRTISTALSSPATTPRSITPTPVSAPFFPNGSTSSLSLLQPPAEPRRARSSSSASVSASASASNEDVSGVGVSFEQAAAAATKAQAWLSTWAPRGEGRSREFFANTLNGVASVASTVSSGIGGTVNTLEQRAGLSRPSSFSPSTGNGHGQSPYSTFSSVNGNGAGNGNGNGFDTVNVRDGGLPMSRGASTSSPPLPLHSNSTSAIPTSTTSANLAAPIASVGRRIPQPSNLSRLGPSSPPTSLSPPNAAPGPSVSGFHRPSLSMSNSGSSTSSLPANTMPRSTSSTLSVQGQNNHHPHHPSNLNPNSRTSSAQHAPPGGHGRSPSLGLAPGSVGNGVRGGGATSPTPSRASSTNTTANGVWRAAMPYKIGFQPAGVRNDRTGEYLADRKSLGEEREKEEGRLGRRWAKLVDLHFNPATQLPVPSHPAPPLPRSISSSSSSFSLSDKRRSFMSMDGALDALKPKEVWKGIKGVANPPTQQEEARKRAVEQAIVKWEPDTTVSKCRICQSTFSLSNRKHHCRLCGRIVCALPPTAPTLLAVQIQLFAPASTEGLSALPPGTRREKCSLLLVADYQSGRGEEVEEGFVGWMKVDPDGSGNESTEISTTAPAPASVAASDVKKERQKSRVSSLGFGGASNGNASTDSANGSGIGTGTGSGSGSASGSSTPLPQQPKEVQVKGIRVCRECWATVSRKQKIADRQRVTAFSRMYQALRRLQSEVEDVMPDFEEQLQELVSSPVPVDPPPALLAAHRHLLNTFASYDHLTKRIAGLPTAEDGSQASVQLAIGRSAAAFLTREMVKVQALSKYQKRLAEEKRKSFKFNVLETSLAEQLRLDDNGDEGRGDGQDDVAVLLQPLLEQEAQLESYIADANAQRKYEDGKALGLALKEIRAEISLVMEGAK